MSTDKLWTAISGIERQLNNLKGELIDIDEEITQSDDVYQRGLDDAWEAARKVAFNSDDGGLDIEKLDEIFDCYTLQQVFKRYTATEAIEKLKAYEEKREAADEIKVGDEITHKSDSVVWKAVCIQIDGDGRHMNLMGHTGAVGYYPVDDFKKTGRHFDIDKILEEMRT